MDTNAVSDGALPSRLAPATAQLFRETPHFKRSPRKNLRPRSRRARAHFGAAAERTKNIEQQRLRVRPFIFARRYAWGTRTICHARPVRARLTEGRVPPRDLAGVAFPVSCRFSVPLSRTAPSGFLIADPVKGVNPVLDAGCASR